MIDFILTNIEVFVTGLVALVLIIYALITRQWMVLRSAALSLMLSAERLMATEEGKKKMDWVYMATWQRLPNWLKTFISEESLRGKLQEWYNMAKDMINE